MAEPRITLQQVADRAGVSRTTASFVLSGRRDMRISVSAQERVLQAARELTYRPSLIARSLRTNLSQTIGLISDLLATEVFAGQAIRGSMDAALLSNHLLLVGETRGDRELERQLVDHMLDRGVDGFIYASLYTRRVRLSPGLRTRRVVLLNCVGSRGSCAVVPDETEGGRAAARTLLEAGHREHIHLLGETPTHVLAGRERSDGIRTELAAHGVELAGQIDCQWWPDSAYRAVGEFLDTGLRATALICLNDRVALGAYQALAERGRTVPDDVSVLSFDDSDLASWIRPHLTSVAIPHLELGRRSVELLLDHDAPGKVHRIPMPVMHRNSVGPPRPARARAQRPSKSRT